METGREDAPKALGEFRAGRHFLQSAPWAEFQWTRGNEVIMRSGPGWEYSAIVEHGKLGNRLYCPYGPTVSGPDQLEDALEDLREQALEQKVDFVRIEPRGEFNSETLSELGLARSHHDVQPPDTIVNLVGKDQFSAEDLAAGLSGNPRRTWRKAARQGVTYRVSYDPEEIDLFLDMIHDVAARTGMQPHTDEYFRDMAASLFPGEHAGLMFAELEGEPVASTVFYSDGETMSYAHAGSFSEHRKLSPATGLLLENMLYARETGHRFYDMYGVAPADAPEDHPWRGFTSFKMGFGGSRVSLPGTWEMPVRRTKYRVYNTAARILERR